MSVPLVSVVMAVHNGEAFISESIDSILNQTWTNFELLIIDDASTDKTTTLIKDFSDHRIKLFKLPKKNGLSKALNIGLQHAQGNYIARMDADDSSHPQRLTEQIAFMEKNSDVVLCGSFIKSIGNSHQTTTYPVDSELLKTSLLFGSPFAHPSVMIRADVLKKNKLEYNEALSTAQDYELWTRLSLFGNFANIPKVLLHYRKHSKQTSKTKRALQLQTAYALSLKVLSSINVSPRPDQASVHQALVAHRYDNATERNVVFWLNTIFTANEKTTVFNRRAIKKTLTNLWLEVALQQRVSLVQVFKSLLKEPFILFDKTLYCRVSILCGKKAFRI